MADDQDSPSTVAVVPIGAPPILTPMFELAFYVDRDGVVVMLERLRGTWTAGRAAGETATVNDPFARQYVARIAPIDEERLAWDQITPMRLTRGPGPLK